MPQQTHRIEITVVNGSLAYEQSTTGPPPPPPPRDGKHARVGHNDRIEWRCGVGNYACLFKGDSPLDPIKTVSGASGSNAPVPPATVTKPHNPGANNEYSYLVVVVKADGTVLSQDPTIIIDH